AMPDRRPWMIYGATGYTGELVAREARRQGLAPIVAGRSSRVTALAAELGLPSRVFSLADLPAVRRALDGVALLANVPCPFTATLAPMLDTCLAARAHYVDITGEIDVFLAAEKRNDEARAAGIVVCPGVGFDVIPTDCVAACLVEALSDATHLALGFRGLPVMSPGTARTSVEGPRHGGGERRGGR